MKKLGSGTHSTVSNYRKETGNATQMGKKAHLELARSGLFVSEIADAEREREKFLHLSFSQRNLEDSRYERNYFVKAKDILKMKGGLLPLWFSLKPNNCRKVFFSSSNYLPEVF